ncbi:tetratricopeptide repeat protein [Nocardia suismassiliense]|uniref:tetratricopeptide repeat protein n=1 Tax=Nocardia suismassiliense TaxID=2077092 RepID=UPI00131F278D|nr:tetratricopeptide repeat protein [Nocardia suismassiliense]
MGGRLALVVGAECSALGELGFTGRLAAELYARLREVGGWGSATGVDGPVLDPTAGELVTAIDVAFERASAQRATLLVAFIGHGTATNSGDFYLMARDSPLVPRSDNAFHLTQGIRERLNTSALDGLIVLVDACETEQGVRGAARLWTGPLARSAGRMELLVAAGDGPAYAGCFTRTMLSTFGAGLPLRGENLLPYDLVDPVARGCALQQPLHLSFTAGTVSTSPGGDAGLWLVPNAARRRDALTGRPAAGVVDQLTRRLLFTDTMRECLAEVIDAGGQRLRAVIGPPGAGKSTLMALLIRPSVVDGLAIAPEYVTAAIFLTASSSLESVAEELSAQLAARVPGYAEALRAAQERAEAAESDVFDIWVRRPLAEVSRPGSRITLVLDGLDQPTAGSRKLLVAAVAELTGREDLRHVRVIAAIREGSGTDRHPDLAHMHRVALPEPTAADIAALVRAGWRELVPAAPTSSFDAPAALGEPAKSPSGPTLTHQGLPPWLEEINKSDEGPVWGTPQPDIAEDEDEDEPARAPEAGGWLLARLQSEVLPSLIGRSVSVGTELEAVVAQRVRTAMYTAEPAASGSIGPLLAILVAAGAGPVLPIELLENAMSSFREDITAVRIRDIAVCLGALITRSNPGTAQESLGIAHNALLPALTAQFTWLDVVIEDAHRAIIAATMRCTSARAVEYARGSTARHYLECGDSGRALAYLTTLETTRAVDNRDLWAAWLPSIEAVAGAVHPDTLHAREYLALRRAESGDLHGAIAEYARLLEGQLEILGPDHANTLSTRFNLAVCRSESGDLADASADLAQVLADRRRVLGADHPATLAARNRLITLQARRGDLSGAIAEARRLLADRRRILGSDHAETMATRSNLAGFLSENGDSAGAIAELVDLLADQVRVLGFHDSRVLLTRAKLATVRAHSGDFEGAIAEFESVLADQLRLHGPDDPSVLRTRLNLAAYRAHAGDLARALTDSEEVLVDQIRVQGRDHRATLLTRGNLASLRAHNGDLPGAIAEAEQVIADQLRILGPDHPDVLVARSNLVSYRKQAGDVQRAVHDAEQLLADRLRVLGPDHPDTLLTRNNLAAYRAHSGDIAGAVADFARLLTDQERVLGAEHRDTKVTRNHLAHWRSRLRE